jgi:hypothetical protein
VDLGRPLRLEAQERRADDEGSDATPGGDDLVEGDGC